MIDFIEMFCGIGGFRLGLEKANKESGQHLSEQLRDRERTRPRRHQSSIEERGKGRGEHSDTENNGSRKASEEDFVESYKGQYKAESSRRRGSVGVGHNGIQTRSYNSNSREVSLEAKSRSGIEKGQHKSLSKRTRERTQFNCVWANDWEYADFKWKPNKKTGKLEWKGSKNHSGKIYRKHWDDGTYIDADIHSIDTDTFPDHDLLTAGFPCQSFSIAGKRLGFQDTRGTLFYEICRVAEAKRPKVLFLENVRGLLSHDEGLTFQVILESLEELGYWCEWQVFNSKHYGVPQNRQRVFIIGHLGDRGGREVFPITESSGFVDGGVSKEPVVSALQSPRHASGNYRGITMIGEQPKTSLLYWKNSKEKWVQEDRTDSLTLKGQSDLVRQPLILQKIGNIAKSGHDSLWGRVYDPEGLSTNLNAKGGGVGAKTGFYIVADRTRSYAGKGRNLESPKNMTNALSSVQKDNLLILSHSPRTNDPKLGGSGPLISSEHSFTIDSTPHKVIKDMRIRRLTPIECERLQGFPDGWTKGVSDTQRYKCLGNAVTTNVIKFLGERIRDRCFTS